MLYQVLVGVTMTAHFAFIAYVVMGGFMAWRWPRTIWLHGCAAAWGVAAIVVGVDCPLTSLENWARLHAGDALLPSTGFIDHYLTGVLYPDSAEGVVRAFVIATVVVSWVGAFALRTRSRTTLRLS